MDLVLAVPMAAPSLSSPRRLLLRRAGRWDAYDTAAHLLACRGRIVGGLAREHPWAGLDDETLEGLWTEAVATITELASSGDRPGWQRPRDLERAAIAAFRHVALAHHRATRAHKRKADREAVPFEPEVHGAVAPGLAALFADPREHVVAEDWLVELDPGPLRSLWKLVLVDELTFKQAGDRLGLAKPDVTRLTRDGRRELSRFAGLHARGLVCSYRRSALDAVAAGTATSEQAERAAAHLGACLPCALVHEPGATATSRGLVGVLPVGLLLRLRDVAFERGIALTDAATGKVGPAVAAAVVAVGAGAGAGIHAGRRDAVAPRVAPAATAAPPVAATTAAAASSAAVSTPSLRRPIPSPRTATVTTATRPPARRKTSKPKAKRAPAPPPVVPAERPAAAPSPPSAELSFEQPRAQPPSPTPASPADVEFSRP